MRNVLKPLGLAVALALSIVGAAQANPYEAPRDDEPRPQMLTLRYEFGGGQPRQWLANGVRLTAPAPAPLRAREQDSGSSAAAIILAIGVGVALVVLVAGDTAEDITDGKDDSGDGGDCLPGMPGC
jgi:hypothetical protein